MVANRADCYRIIQEAAAGRLDDNEIDELIEELDTVRRRRRAEGARGSLERELFDKAEELVADAELAAKIEERNRLINIVKGAELEAIAARADAANNDPSLGLEAAMVGVNAPFAGGRLSADAISNGMLRQYMGGMLADMRRAQRLVDFNSGAHSRDIARELWDLSLKQPTGKATRNRAAKEIAGIVHKYRQLAIQRENRAGAFIRLRQGYVTRQSHNPARMVRAGKDAWAAAVADRLDWEAMGIAPQDRAGFLESAYETLTTGVRKEFDATDGLKLAFKGPGNLAKKQSAHRTLLFKSADDWYDYDQQFGMSGLNEAIASDFRRAAMSTALMEKFGPNPRALFDRVRTKLAQEHRGDAGKVRRLQRRNLDHFMDEIDGTSRLSANYTVSSISAGVRAIQSMAKLGGAFLSSIADVAAAAAARRAGGRSIAESWMDGFSGIYEGLSTTGEKRRFAELIGVGIDGAVGDFVSRFSAQDDVPGGIAKAQAMFFKFNLLGPWTDGVKRGIGMMTARDLALDAKMPWNRLSAARRTELGRYGLDAKTWEIAKKAVVKGPDGKDYLLPGELREAVIEGVSAPEAARLKDQVQFSLMGMYADIADAASPTPGAREQALLRQGLQPGTAAGEAIRFIAQFKAFPVTVTSKVLGRALYGRGAKSLRDALVRGEGDILGLVSFMAGGTALGYIALQAKELAKGRSPREDTYGTVIAAMLQGGGLGIYGDFLLGETNRFGRSLLDTLAGPTLGTIADLDQLRAKAMAGEDVYSPIIRIAQSNMPGVNLFYTKAAIDYLFLYQLQEMASPGYLRRTERRIEREQGQEFLIPPSRTIPRGGGDRIFEGVR